MNLKEKTQAFSLDQAMSYLSGDPEKNLPKLLAWVDRIGWAEKFSGPNGPKETIHKILDDPENVWHRYIMNLWKDIDNDILKTVFHNFVLNAALLGFPKQEALSLIHI